MAEDSLRQELFVQLKSLAYAELVPGINERLAELEQLAQYQDQRSFDILATDSLLVYKSVIAQLQSNPSWLFKHQMLVVPRQSFVELNPPFSAVSIKEELHRLRPQIKRFERSVVLAEWFRKQPPHQLELLSHNRVIKQDQFISNGHRLLDVLYSYGDISKLIMRCCRSWKSSITLGRSIMLSELFSVGTDLKMTVLSALQRLNN